MSSNSSSYDESDKKEAHSNSIAEKENKTNLETGLKSLQPQKETGEACGSKTDKETYLPSEVELENYLFYSKASLREEELWEKGGKWMFFSPNDIQTLDSWCLTMKKLCDDGKLAAIKASTAINKVECVILCYTSDSKNEEEIENAAIEIRKVINIEHPLYYKANEGSKESDIYLYVHSATGEFSNKEHPFLLPLEVYWKDHILRYGDEGYPTTEVKLQQGKWHLPLSENEKELDDTFLALEKLRSEGKLISFSISTICSNSKYALCFTSNIENKTEIKVAADGIRENINHKYTLNYSPRDRAKQDHQYMHTVACGFYEKDRYERWKKSDIEVNREHNN